MPEPRFRLATESDLSEVLEFMREYYIFDGHAFSEPEAREALLSFLRNPSLGWAWLICDHDDPVGYIVLTLGYSLEFLGRDAFVDEFFISESHRSRGWGRKSLDYVEDFARAHDVRAIHLEVVRSNRNAYAVYQKLGFRDRGHHLMTKRIDRGFEKSGS